MLNDGGGDTWICRRDPKIRVPYDDAIRVKHGIPFLAPHLQLLFKASTPRPKDDADFAASVGYLTPTERSWLADHIGNFDPGHAWLSPLQRARSHQ
jgi:hypothetical protein